MLWHIEPHEILESTPFTLSNPQIKAQVQRKKPRNLDVHVLTCELVAAKPPCTAAVQSSPTAGCRRHSVVDQHAVDVSNLNT